jgi:hypothetical protein
MTLPPAMTQPPAKFQLGLFQALINVLKTIIYY